MNAEIRFLGDPALHFWLTRSVAREVGVNLHEALTEGVISASDYAQLVTNCRLCPNVEECEAWLSVCHQQPAAPPEHCINGAALCALRACEAG